MKNSPCKRAGSMQCHGMMRRGTPAPRCISRGPHLQAHAQHSTAAAPAEAGRPGVHHASSAAAAMRPKRRRCSSVGRELAALLPRHTNTPHTTAGTGLLQGGRVWPRRRAAPAKRKARRNWCMHPSHHMLRSKADTAMHRSAAAGCLFGEGCDDCAQLLLDLANALLSVPHAAARFHMPAGSSVWCAAARCKVNSKPDKLETN
ncbi:hypothetical protein COO60DRAFT_271163 [Scenedesmus sp. NREL 46B-D3]|nr:hypothetical protein COO60DRAFT_271163 [Scenedesmus sp. NREL 46B-D3]